MPSPLSRLSSRSQTSPPSPIAHPKTTSSSILKRPMRTAASYLTALSQADADARARNIASDSEFGETALSLRSSLHSNDSMSNLTTTDSEDYYDDDLEHPPHPPTSEQQITTKHSEFGHCFNEAYRHTSVFQPGTAMSHPDEEPPYYVLMTAYLSYLAMIVFGHLRDFLGKRFCQDAYSHLMPSNVSYLLWFGRGVCF